jgi:hypothetical protein
LQNNLRREYENKANHSTQSNDTTSDQRTHQSSIAERSSTTAAVLKTMLTTIRKTKDRKDRKRLLPIPTPRKKIDRNSEHLVIYSYYVHKRVDKLRKRGFKIKLDMVENLGMKFAIVEDPNGVEIWIVDATNEMVNETDSKGRLVSADTFSFNETIRRLISYLLSISGLQSWDITQYP